MKVMQRRAAAAVALTLGTLSAPTALIAQTSRGPTQDTPRLLVAVFAANERTAGVQAADAVRSRVSNGANPRFLYVVPKNDIVNYLESSGYRADSSLGPNDLKELARLLRADEILFGHVMRTAAGYVIEPRLLLARDPTVAQPLGTFTVREPDDAARDIERALEAARRQLADNRACENALRDQQHMRAIAAANEAIKKYPNATMARICLASAYQAMKLPPDSLLRIADEISGMDPKSSWAARFKYSAYDQKGDKENAARALITLMALEPWNTQLVPQVINALASLGRPQVALGMVDTLLMQNPGDPTLLRQRWLLSLAAAAAADSGVAPGLYEQALAAGENLVRIDSALADTSYFERQIAAAALVSPQRGAEFAARAVTKFPSNAEFWAIKAQLERRAGQLQSAEQSIRRSLQINPSQPNARLMQAQIFVDLNMPDSAVALARSAVAAGEDPKTWGAMLLNPMQAAFKKAQETKANADYEKALALAEESNKMSPSAAASYFTGAAAFTLGLNILQEASRTRSCPLARRAQDLMVKVQIEMPKGVEIDKDSAGQIMNYAMQYSTNADQMVRAYCR